MFADVAWAQGAAANDPMAQFFGGPLSPLVMMGLMFAIMYFMLIRPQQQERKKLQQQLEALKKGDKVLTTSGIYATVVGVEPTKVVLKIADDVKVEFAKSAVAQVIPESK
jgi:preprotein translocase subunit YajC